MAKKPEPPAEEEANGIRCPKCGCGHMHVYRVVKLLGVIAREKRCRHCGAKAFTREILRN
jgi:hypothetical protein